MTSIGRIKKIQEKLQIGAHKESIQYYTGLMVHKDKSFEESQTGQGGFNNAWLNNKVNANRGKKYLGLFSLDEKPHVARKLKEIYEKTQEQIKDNSTASCAIVWVTIIEKEKWRIGDKRKRKLIYPTFST